MTETSGMALAKAVSVGRRRSISCRMTLNQIDIMKTIDENRALTPCEHQPLIEGSLQEPVSSNVFRMVALSFLCLLSGLLQAVCLPLYHATLVKSGSDPYIGSVLAALLVPLPLFFYCFVCIVRGYDALRIPREAIVPMLAAASLCALTSVLVSLSSLPSRAAPTFQSVLSNVVVPSAAIARWCILSEGIPSRQVGCIILIFIGILIALAPDLMQRPHIDDDTPCGGRSWYFLLVYGLAWVPLGVALPLLEKIRQKFDIANVTCAAYIQLLSFICICFGFWLDFVPYIGMADGKFLVHLRRGLSCWYSSSNCFGARSYGIVLVLSAAMYCLSSLALLHSNQPGSLYISLVLTLVTAISSLFWHFFSASPALHWDPRIDSSTLLLFLGLLIMSPGVAIYATTWSDQSNPTDSQPRIEHESKYTRRGHFTF